MGVLCQREGADVLGNPGSESSSSSRDLDVTLVPSRSPFPPKVIYKKFQVPCPLPLNLANITGNFSHTEVVEEKVQLQGEPEAAALCTPSYFTLNSQVPTGHGRDGGPGCKGLP